MLSFCVVGSVCIIILIFSGLSLPKSGGSPFLAAGLAAAGESGLILEAVTPPPPHPQGKARLT